MTRLDKLLAKLKRNPRDWSIEQLFTIAKRYKIDYRQPGTSHVTFRFKNGKKLTVPAHKPIKPIYIKLFIELFDEQRY